MRSPGLQRELPSGKKWLKFDIAKIQRGLGIDQLTQLGTSNPADSLGNLRGAGDVKRLGTAPVRGVDCTHHTATIDFRKLPSRLPAADRASAQKGVERLIKLRGGDATQDFEIWIDRKKLVRRLHLTQPIEPAPGKKVNIDQTIDFFDFGAATSVIRIPPADQVQDATPEAVSRGGNRAD